MPSGSRPQKIVVPTGSAKAEALAALWTKRFDPQAYSVKSFIEAYRVPTKKVGLLGGESLVKFREYPNQAVIRETMERQWAEGEGCKQAIGKPRQDGITTDCALLFFERFCRGGGGTWNLFSYDDDAVRELFRLVLSFKKQTPAWAFVHLWAGGRHGQGVWRKQSAKQLELEFEDGTTSLLQCLTAGDKSSGSGSAPRGVLWDEFSKWNPEVKRDPTSMSEGWQDAPGNLFIIPSTGQGEEEFAALFRDIYEGRSKDSGFVAQFFPWLGHPDRRKEFRQPHERAQLIAAIGRDKGYGVRDEEALVAAGATPEELWWRRTKLAGVLQFNLDLMRREYPLTPSDMFADSTRTVFHGQVDVLKSHQVPANARARDARTGGFKLVLGDTVDRFDVVWEDYPHGLWTLFEERSEGTFYVFGADCTSGRQQGSSGGKSSDPDYALGDFGELFSGRCVAQYRAHSEGRLFAQELFAAACYFRGRDKTGACGFIEANAYGEATIATFMEMEHGRIGGADLMLRRPPKVDTGPTTGERTQVVGWDTHMKSREVLIDSVRDFLTEVGVYVPGTPTPLNAQFVNESLLFERNPKTGKPEARRGKDDAVFAKALMIQARDILLRGGYAELRTTVRVVDPSVDPMVLYTAGLAAQKRAEAGKNAARSSPLLGRAF